MHSIYLTMKLNVYIALFFSAYSLAVVQSETFQVIEPEKIPGILRIISNQTKANFEKIHTWQAELESSHYSIDRGENAKNTFKLLTDARGHSPDEVARLSENKIIFKCDFDKDSFYSNDTRENPSRFIDPVTNKDLGTKSLPRSSTQIVTKEYRYSADPILRRKGEVVQRKATKEKADKSSCESPAGVQPVYLPLYIFDMNSQVWGYYPDIIKIIEEKGEYIVDGLALKVEQRTLSGDVQYRVYEPFMTATPDMKNFWMVNIFSTNAGYNRISREMTSIDGKLMQKQSTEYQKINNVYVPIKSTEDTYDFRDFRLRSHTERVFKNVRINDVIPDEIFTYKNLGLKNGDKYIDKIEGKEFEYKDDKLVELATKPVKDENDNQ